ncbi:dTMP kinase [Paracraurococcus lichenis]|uniref:Thymidylate kinase n=1 Tax=Paracraurococcus lichenis TaxID=3064888 RepID=A0ABT9DXK2_9PROT|nr:dTMP kinase [Paracraurococcus sp. LOR1-02]MDO9708632.1 dTMP kinase [Paracraurococcus sp. LOR1-02]
MARGRFITLEGGEGAGKSTQARLLEAALTAEGRRVLRTREPGGAPGAEAIRGVLLGQGPQGIAQWDGIAECMLHFAARREHVVRTIRPALEAGTWVVCDRFADSTMAYQVFGQGVPRAVFDALAAVALEGLAPDLTLVLDIGPAEGLARAAARGETNRYEALDPDFHERVRAGFRAIAAAEPARCAMVDATAAPEGVAAEIMKVVRARLGA